MGGCEPGRTPTLVSTDQLRPQGDLDVAEGLASPPAVR